MLLIVFTVIIWAIILNHEPWKHTSSNPSISICRWVNIFAKYWLASTVAQKGFLIINMYISNHNVCIYGWIMGINEKKTLKVLIFLRASCFLLAPELTPLKELGMLRFKFGLCIYLAHLFIWLKFSFCYFSFWTTKQLSFLINNHAND